jgi:Polyphosphate kinase 2 (PPK2)
MPPARTARSNTSCPVSILKVPGLPFQASVHALPERGRIGIFNRSHYEEFLSFGVHPELLRAEGLPDEARDDKTIWRDRYRSIRHFEAHLHRNGTHIVKFFLHLSKEEQRKRFLARLEEPDKTGNSAGRTSKKGNIGTITWTAMKLA